MKKPPDLEGFQEFCNIQKESKKNTRMSLDVVQWDMS